MTANDKAEGKKRPIWVWVISIYFFVSAGGTLLSFYFINIGIVPLNPRSSVELESLTRVEYVAIVTLGVALLIGAIALFLQRPLALQVFVFMFIANGALTIWHPAAKIWVEAFGGLGLFGDMLSLGLQIAVFFYAWKLIQRGILA